MLGGGASVVLEGQRVLPAAAASAGFRHAHATLGPAVRHVLR
jgi:NAD dependent epimerase/dehydratase family enzyme